MSAPNLSRSYLVPRLALIAAACLAVVGCDDDGGGGTTDPGDTVLGDTTAADMVSDDVGDTSLADTGVGDSSPPDTAGDDDTAGDVADLDDAADTGDTTTGDRGGPLQGREREPVVLRGAELQALIGQAPDDLVGFAWRDGAWQQIPVQVDERVISQPRDHYVGFETCGNCVLGTVLLYADPLTYTGADTDVAFDPDDELVFMARDAGAVPADYTAPAGVDTSAPAARVRLTDPLEPGAEAFVHLFVRQASGGLEPAAGQDLVDYTIGWQGTDNMSHGMDDYRTHYQLAGGEPDGPVDGCTRPKSFSWPWRHPETSLVSTAHYEAGFAERWIHDQLTPTATGIDLLDVHISRSTIEGELSCQRSPDSYTGGRGGYFTQKDGAVRAIRSVFGANSSPYTERTMTFYDGRYTVWTHLRVHAIGGPSDLYDYSPDLAGATYWNNALGLDSNGLTIDGVPEAVAIPNEPLTWELVSSTAGSLVMSHGAVTNLTADDGIAVGSFFQDESDAPCQCLGDGHAFGASGTSIGRSAQAASAELPDTNINTPDHVHSRRTVDVFGRALDDATERARRVEVMLNPVAAEAAALDATLGVPTGPSCGDGACDAGEQCLVDCFEETCGNGLCEATEATGDCEADCPWLSCGDGVCQPYEANILTLCEEDCGAGGAACGDTSCDSGDGETPAVCPIDCPSPNRQRLICAFTGCDVDYQACLADDTDPNTSCLATLECIAQCGAGSASCIQGCRGAATGNSQALLDTLFACYDDNPCDA